MTPLLGTIFSLWMYPATPSSPLATQYNFIENRWRPRGLIQLYFVKETQKQSHLASAGWPRKTEATTLLSRVWITAT